MDAPKITLLKPERTWPEYEAEVRLARVRAKIFMRSWSRESGGYGPDDLLHDIEMTRWLTDWGWRGAKHGSSQHDASARRHLMYKISVIELAVTRLVGTAAPGDGRRSGTPPERRGGLMPTMDESAGCSPEA